MGFCPVADFSYLDPDTWRYRLLYPVELNVIYVNLLNKVLTGGRLVRLSDNKMAWQYLRGHARTCKFCLKSHNVCGSNPAAQSAKVTYLHLKRFLYPVGNESKNKKRRIIRILKTKTLTTQTSLVAQAFFNHSCCQTLKL